MPAHRTPRWRFPSGFPSAFGRRGWLLLGVSAVGALTLIGWGTIPLMAQASGTPAASEATVQLRREPPVTARSQRALGTLPSGVKVTLLVQDLVTGEVRESLEPGTPMIPASTTKLVTAAATLGNLGEAAGWWSTELTVPAAEWGQARVSALTLRGSADPTLKVDGGGNSLDELAGQVAQAGIKEVGVVTVDDRSIQPASWEAAVIGTPMSAFMPGDRPNWLSHSPEARRAEVQGVLIQSLERAGVTVLDQRPVKPGDQVSEQASEGVASVQGRVLYQLLADILRPSDNLGAEELLASVAAKPGGPGTLAGGGQRALALLRGWGVDTRGSELHDGSGLTRDNRLTARTLVDLLDVMYRTGGEVPQRAAGGTARGGVSDPLRIFAEDRNLYAAALPRAGVGGSKYGPGGTMAQRLTGQGLDVRAKTGTLPGVSSLAGYVVGASGHPLAFAILMNGPETAPTAELRAAQDRWVEAVAAQY